MPALPIIKREISVKNTFIVDDEEEEHEAIEIHQCGARTCVARLSEHASSSIDEDEPCVWMLEDGASDTSDERATKVERAVVHDRGLSDTDTFASTPTGSECDFDIAQARRSELPTSVSAPECPVRERISLDLSVPPVARRQVMVQIPIELPCDVETPANGMKATVINSHINRDAECITIDLRLALSSTTMSSPSVSQPVITCTSPGVLACGTISWPIGAFPLRALKATAQPSNASPSTDKAVCCHWKNKGWCKYQQSCKFLHPEHKRGVGSLKQALPFPLCRTDRRRL